MKLKFLNTIYTPLFLLSVIGAFMVMELFVPITELYAFERTHFFVNHLMHIGIGILALLVMSRLDHTWFDRIGAGVLSVAVVTFAAKMLLPEISLFKDSIRVGSALLEYVLFFTLGAIWFVDFSQRYGAERGKWLLHAVAVLLVLVWMGMFGVDAPMMIALMFSVLGMVFYRYGFSKILLGALGGVVGVFALILIAAPHRVARLKSWWSAATGESSYPQMSDHDLLYSKMHEGMFFYNEWYLLLGLVTVLFVWLIVLVWRTQTLFAKGVATLLAVDVVFHWLIMMHLIPVKAPAVFFLEYGASITLMSFLMLGMVRLRALLNQ